VYFLDAPVFLWFKYHDFVPNKMVIVKNADSKMQIDRRIYWTSDDTSRRRTIRESTPKKKMLYTENKICLDSLNAKNVTLRVRNEKKKPAITEIMPIANIRYNTVVPIIFSEHISIFIAGLNESTTTVIF